MVNDFRCCLLNERPPVIAGPGEEYVPESYRPAVVPAAVDAARAALFGPGSDRAGRNLTLARILAYAHTSRLAADVTAADPRVTYDPRRPADVWDSLGALAVATTGAAAVGWRGSASFPAAGRAYGEWVVDTDGAGGYTLTAADGRTRAGSVVTDSVGDGVPLTGSDLSVVVPASAAGRWRVTLLIPPPHAWPSAAAAEAEGVFLPHISAAEAAWFAAWSDMAEPAPLRALALALAVAARTRELLPPEAASGR